MGDLNVDYLVQNNYQEIKDIFKTNGFSQLLTTATRVTETTTLIDVIQTNNASNISHKTVILSGLSDHNLIACVRKMNN